MNVWEALGLSGKRAIILHQDDIGMLDAAGRAYVELGLPSGSIMAPGTWATQVKNGDLGVHITLTSEWVYPRMRPLTQGASLRDESGHFWSTLESAWMNIQPEEAVAEMRAQVEAVYRLGIDVTHIDTHMGAVMRPDIAHAYHQIAIDYKLALFLPNSLEARGLPEPMRAQLEQILERTPLPTVTWIDSYPVPPEDRRTWYLETLQSLGPGVYHLNHHAAVNTPELQVLPDWQKRVGDFESLRDEAVRKVLSDDYILLTYRDVRDAIRKYL